MKLSYQSTRETMLSTLHELLHMSHRSFYQRRSSALYNGVTFLSDITL